MAKHPPQRGSGDPTPNKPKLTLTEMLGLSKNARSVVEALRASNSETEPSPTVVPQLYKSLENLRDLAERYNQITDRANETVRVVESFLEDCSLGVPVGVLVSTDASTEPPGTGTSTYLAYNKLGQRFRIVVDVIGPPHGSNMKAWSDVPREQKLETLPHLPLLLEEIVAKLTAKVKEAEETVNSVICSLPSSILQRNNN